tara:strand:+ start:1996 stop:2709 length:714 start_codon:yes stop_codon:yes gene_type:complete
MTTQKRKREQETLQAEKNEVLLKKARFIMEKKSYMKPCDKRALTIRGLQLLNEKIKECSHKAYNNANKKGLFECDYEYHGFLITSFNTSMGNALEEIVGLNANILCIGKGLNNSNKQKIKGVDHLIIKGDTLFAIDLKSSTNTTSGTFVKIFQNILDSHGNDKTKAYRAIAFYKWHEQLGSIKDNDFTVSPETFWEYYVGMYFKPLQDLFHQRYVRFKQHLACLKDKYPNGINNKYI